MDAPLLPGAESSNGADGGLPPGQASAFRRALDAQVESADPATALVPSGPHDLTRPIDVNALRAALTASQTVAKPRESVPGFPQAASGSDAATALAETAVADLSAVLPQAATAAPSPGGPTVVVPAVSVPGLRAPTTIVTPTPTFVVPRGGEGGAALSPAPPPGPESENGREQEHSPRHSGGSGTPSRISTTIGVSVLLAAIAATALVLISVGRSSGPLAPDAMPTKSATQSQSPVAVAPPHSAKPSHKPSPSPSHSPGHSPSPSPSPSKPSPSPSTVTNFATIRWTSQYDPVVADIQSRLAKLRYLALDRNGSQYDATQHTVMANGNRWWQPSDQIGYYQNATSLAIRAFEYDYLQHDQGQPPGDGSCDAATYQALIDATS